MHVVVAVPRSRALRVYSPGGIQEPFGSSNRVLLPVDDNSGKSSLRVLTKHEIGSAVVGSVPVAVPSENPTCVLHSS